MPWEVTRRLPTQEWMDFNCCWDKGSRVHSHKKHCASCRPEIPCRTCKSWSDDVIPCFLNQITCSDHLDGLKIKQCLRHSWLERAWRQSSLWFYTNSCSHVLSVTVAAALTQFTFWIHHPLHSDLLLQKLYKHHPSHEFLFLLFIDAMPFHYVHSQCSSGSNSHSLALPLAPMKVDLSELALTHPQKWSYSPVLQFPTEGVEYPLQEV